MNRYLKVDPWCIIEEGFNPANQRASESIFSLGNGRMGQRANFEEGYSGESLQGTYLAGVYYPDKTRVGWWKIGYPEYFAKVLNAPSFTGIHIAVNNEPLDLHVWKVPQFRRVLNMKEGTLSRHFVAENSKGLQVEVEAMRFISMDDPNLAVMQYTVKLPVADGELTITPFLEGDIHNEDANYNEQFWDIRETGEFQSTSYLEAITRKTGFIAGMAMVEQLFYSGNNLHAPPLPEVTEHAVTKIYSLKLGKGQSATIYKYVGVISSLYAKAEEIKERAVETALKAKARGFSALFQAHKAQWANIWNHCDIVIDGDTEAQQGIRFSIFHLNQTYRGDDPRLNIGPKGFTGEKYGGSTYWDTEAFCIPFFLSTAPAEVSRNLLIYRYRHLEKAIENAASLGFGNHAALYPMVTMNGEECHNEWEITFEEIHRNGAIAYAIFNYVRYTGDTSYLADFGLEVLIAIARFWAQRATFSTEKKLYVILGVTGPNEYENNVNNNWYTNTMASWCLEYTIEVISQVKASTPKRYLEISQKWNVNEPAETAYWQLISSNMYLPFDESLKIYLQQEGYLDKEQLTAIDIPANERPINQYWSWDRILRSCFIKQADVLQGIFLFEERFDRATIKRHFDFYEPRTVHESSLSACIYSIMASRINVVDKAYELYLRTARLDIDDYNKEVREGLHITSMAGTWMTVVYGFGGLLVSENQLCLYPSIPGKWTSYSFRVMFRGTTMKVTVNHEKVRLENIAGNPVPVKLYGSELLLDQLLELEAPECLYT